jgi:ribosomal protein L11 methyltransferase
MHSANQSNPFRVSPRQWQIRVAAHYSQIQAVEDVLGDLAVALSSYELNEAALEWCVEAITDSEPQREELDARLSLMSGLMGIPTPVYSIAPLEHRDWIHAVERSFPPLNVGRFYVHGSHVTDAVPQGKIALHINAGAAFGSGEHATTSGCLMALSTLSKRRRFFNSLDMGCGSGILALGMAKLWHTRTTGIDIDPVSARVATRNAALNQVSRYTSFAAADGYRAELVRKRAPFDLIAANILARPLTKMAPWLAKNLAPDGIAVLSGLLVSQERRVLAAHRMQGLRLVSRIRIHGWSTLVLAK